MEGVLFLSVLLLCSIPHCKAIVQGTPDSGNQYSSVSRDCCTAAAAAAPEAAAAGSQQQQQQAVSLQCWQLTAVYCLQRSATGHNLRTACVALINLCCNLESFPAMVKYGRHDACAAALTHSMLVQPLKRTMTCISVMGPH
jgi:hypothetical protein